MVITFFHICQVSERNELDKNGGNAAGINQCEPRDMDMDTPDLNQNKNAVNVPDVEVKKISKHKLKNNTRYINMSNM